MDIINISRILSGNSRGSSRPVIAETSAGKYFVKLRGAAQGCGALISEIIVSELADALHLPLLPKCLALLDPQTATEDKDDELEDLLSASAGLNLAFPYLENAREATDKEYYKLTTGERAAVLWLDRLVMNPDRTIQNPNILFVEDKVYLIDHGACLRFQYNWPNISEETPKNVGLMFQPHIFEAAFEFDEWQYWDQLFAQCITRSVLEKALNEVPDDFINSLLSSTVNTQTPIEKTTTIERRKQAYVAFLWKRLKTPRDFALLATEYQKIGQHKVIK